MPHHPALPSKACASHARYEHAFRQVFGLAGCLLTPASQSMAEPVLSLERSFLLTAAGQFQIFTGFPFKLDHADRAPESDLNIEHPLRAGQRGAKVPNGFFHRAAKKRA